MVKLTEVEDEHYSEKPSTLGDEVLLADDDDDYTDTDSEISSTSGDYDSVYTPPAETITDRLVALRDMVPPRARARISSTTVSIYNLTGSAINYGGKGLWVLATTAFLLGIPYALALGQEQEIVEEEKRQGMMSEGASSMLQGGAGGEGGEVRQTL